MIRAPIVVSLPIADRPSSFRFYRDGLGLGADTDEEVDEMVLRTEQAGADVVTQPGRQPWGYAGAFADPDGHVWMITSETLPG